VVAGLSALLSDPSPRVREAAEQSLDEIQKRGLSSTQRLSPIWSQPTRGPL
jgi:hypothetical protein